jgi:hypothetical protein
MLRGDLFEVFTCLDVNDLKRVAANAVALSLGARIDDADDEVRRICGGHGFAIDDLLSARRRVMQMPGIEATTKRRDTMKRGLAAVSNLPAFLAALEGYSRRVSGGGSISMHLFQNEKLTDVHVEGSALGARVSTGRDPAKMSSSCSARASGTSS